MSRQREPAKRDHTTNPVTPWSPSKRATAKVKNPLPAPEVCNCCGGPVELMPNQRIYGQPYGDWPWAFACTRPGCGAYVGLHPFTGIPLGTLATAEIRKARRIAKDLFNPLWLNGAMTRTEAYAWLAQAMGIANVEECHIAWFDAAQCQRAIDAINARTP